MARCQIGNRDHIKEIAVLKDPGVNGLLISVLSSGPNHGWWLTRNWRQSHENKIFLFIYPGRNDGFWNVRKPLGR